MDDIVNSVPSWMFTAIIAVCILFIGDAANLLI